MGILVPNMEMPKGCSACVFASDVEDWGGEVDFKCEALNEYVYPSFAERADDCPLVETSDVDMNIYDVEEIHENCTVQILKNSVTGKISVGWWDNNVDSD